MAGKDGMDCSPIACVKFDNLDGVKGIAWECVLQVCLLVRKKVVAPGVDAETCDLYVTHGRRCSQSEDGEGHGMAWGPQQSALPFPHQRVNSWT